MAYEEDKVHIVVKDSEVMAGRAVVKNGRYGALLISNQHYTESPDPLEPPIAMSMN